MTYRYDTAASSTNTGGANNRDNAPEGEFIKHMRQPRNHFSFKMEFMDLYRMTLR